MRVRERVQSQRIDGWWLEFQPDVSERHRTKGAPDQVGPTWRGPALSCRWLAGPSSLTGSAEPRFDKRERRVYSHDTGVLRAPFRVLAGPSLADGVVQPETEDQLVRFAVAEADAAG